MKQVLRRYNQLRKWDWIINIQEILLEIPHQVEEEMELMNGHYHADSREMDCLKLYLWDVLITRLTHYEHLIEVGFFLELLLWKNCLALLDREMGSDVEARIHARMDALSMLSIVFSGVIDFL
jgi:hypothetical protein